MQTSPMFQQQPTMASTVVAPPHNTVPVKATRILGIFQIVIGTITCVFGIAVAAAIQSYWVGNYGFGIWGGIWMLGGGIIGVCSAARPTNSCLNKTNMAFAIVSCIVAFSQCSIYSVAIWYYRTYSACVFVKNYSSWPYSSWDYTCSSPDASTGTALYATLVVAMIAEFGISLAVAISCCKHGCGCCANSIGGAIIQDQPQTTFIQSSGVAYSAQPTFVTVPASNGYVSTYPNQQMMQPQTICKSDQQVSQPTKQPYTEEPPAY